jgi:hypothetical protein
MVSDSLGILIAIAILLILGKNKSLDFKIVNTFEEGAMTYEMWKFDSPIIIVINHEISDLIAQISSFIAHRYIATSFLILQLIQVNRK